MANSFTLTGPHWSELPTRGEIPSRPSIAKNSWRFWRRSFHRSRFRTWTRSSLTTNPRDIAPRLGISAKAASARMKRFKAKLGVIYSGLTTRIKAPP